LPIDYLHAGSQTVCRQANRQSARKLADCLHKKQQIKNATNRMAIITAIAFASTNLWEQFNNISNQYVF
jgi:DNA topoisomerase VI subunit B